uniref:Uncharacterized protein n=1 Tax=Zea mays TaxID=4577 RepID=C4J2Y7_MAIZE|nr:unknown [Zea mays]
MMVSTVTLSRSLFPQQWIGMTRRKRWHQCFCRIFMATWSVQLKLGWDLCCY